MHKEALDLASGRPVQGGRLRLLLEGVSTEGAETSAEGKNSTCNEGLYVVMEILHKDLNPSRPAPARSKDQESLCSRK